MSTKQPNKISVKLNDIRLHSTTSFVISQTKISHTYDIMLRLPHEHEINPAKLSTTEQYSIQFQFQKHQEGYKGSFVSYNIEFGSTDDKEQAYLLLFLKAILIS